ncbi:unnamed protein product [Paramecium pentaurelia]|uniref:Uncharacterized protein n=1 Tax=Paramecium pentaurelia TaxID=43138 RepID=A0A8S1TWU7_9CILI|nr:unnamed protein product [Paramecium pentaurelia]
MKTSRLSFQRENEETVWHTRKLRQETEKDILLMKNRLKLLKRGDAQLSKKIDEIKKKTKSMIELKKNHHQQIEQKKLSQKNDEELLKDKQKFNYCHKKQQEEQLAMIKKAMEQIKLEEYKRIKEISLKNSKFINKQKQDFITKNRERREQIQENLSKSKTNISIYWNEKLSHIHKENEKAKLENKRVCEQNRAYQEKMEMEESYMMQKLLRSQEVQKKLTSKLEKAKNLPHKEFNHMIKEEDQHTYHLKTNKSVELPRWLPTPEKEIVVTQNLDSEPKQNTEQQIKDDNHQDKQD